MIPVKHLLWLLITNVVAFTIMIWSLVQDIKIQDTGWILLDIAIAIFVGVTARDNFVKIQERTNNV